MLILTVTLDHSMMNFSKITGNTEPHPSLAIHIKHATAHNGTTAPMYIKICRKLRNNYGIGLGLVFRFSVAVVVVVDSEIRPPCVTSQARRIHE